MKDRTEKKRRKAKEKNGYKPHRRRPPHLSQPLRLLHTAIHLGGNFSTSVAARKFNTAWSHSSLESSSETCTCRHLPAFQPVTFPTAFQSAFCWSLHRLQWRKRCSRVWAAVPLRHQHLSSSRWPNRFR